MTRRKLTEQGGRNGTFVRLLLAAMVLLGGCGHAGRAAPVAAGSRRLPDVLPGPQGPLHFRPGPGGSEVASLCADCFFDFDSATMRQRAMASLAGLLPELTSDARSIMVIGHTDGVGNTKHNIDLSRARAGAVRKWLVSNDIAASRITTEGDGPAGTVDNEPNPAMRRVDIVLK